MPVKPGDILRGKFRIDALIGRGGMGHVYSATELDDPDLRQVAIKVVSRTLVDDVLMVRLRREAEAAQRIQSAFVPRVFEVDDTADGETFLVMELLVGEPLSQRIKDNGALPWSEVAQIGEDILRGIADAHAAGIIHRDLKPSNVFLARREGGVRAMVLDFGVCKMAGIDAERLTGTGESIGTVAYMAPEQIRGAARVDERADIFAFGAVAFEMLSGRLPHEGPTQMAILARKLESPAVRLSECARVAIPAGTDAVVLRALARDPKDRYAEVPELIEAWRALAVAGPLVAPGAVPELPRASLAGDPATEISRPPHFAPVAAPAETHPTQTALATHHTSVVRGGGGTRLALVLAACGLLCGIVVVGVSFGRGSAPAGPSAGASPSAVDLPSGTGEPAASLDPGETFELPADPAPGAPATRPRAFRARPAARPAPPPVAPPKGSGPRITPQPRY